MPYGRRTRSRVSPKQPINYLKHCVEDISTIATQTIRTQILCLATIGDETTTTVGTGTRAENVQVGSKIFSIDCEVLLRAQAGNAQGVMEWALVVLPPNQVFTAEQTDINNTGLARDEIGRYSGNVLRTGMVPFNINIAGKMHQRIKLPKSKRRMSVGSTVVFVTQNHSNGTADWYGKFIYKSYI